MLTMPVQYYINANYVCNERCTFCAADMGARTERTGLHRYVATEQLIRWLDQFPPGAEDRAVVAGGEPTLHPELIPFLQCLRERFSEIYLFTNGLRLRNARLAKAVLENGVTRVEVALFGATSQQHDQITGVPGSFEITLEAVNNLSGLRAHYGCQIEIRLLISRQTFSQNAAIVTLIGRRLPGIDAISLNRLVLSNDAVRADSTVSWEEARTSVNESATLIRKFGYRLIFRSIPLCVFAGHNASFVRKQMFAENANSSSGSRWKTLYLDPLVSSDNSGLSSDQSHAPLAGPCIICDYLPHCQRVESWYLDRYGDGGLQTVQLERIPRPSL
jgi:wyosine [tRNA(Phe)-imidazoG37] synthetase (radical SAM superfamily)